MNIIQEKLTTFHQFEIILISIFSEVKSSFITPSALSLIIISILSRFECLTRSSSLSMEELKLFAIGQLNFMGYMCQICSNFLLCLLNIV